MQSRSVLIGIAIVLLLPILVYLSGAVFFVSETENVLITRFGEIQSAIYSGFDQPLDEDPRLDRIRDTYRDQPQEIKTGAGLYFKVPFIDQVHSFSARLQRWDGEEKNVSTMDLRTLSINTSGFYRIVDIIKFYRSFRGGTGINRIGGVIDRQIEDELSRTRLIEAVRNENLQLEERVKKRLEQASEEEERDAAKIRYGRKELIRRILEGSLQQEDTSKSLRESLSDRFGVELTDIMFTQLNYTPQVRQAVYDRMIAERKRIAARYRARGEQQKREILGEVERRKNEMLSAAEREVKNILGEAERDRIEIHAKSFSQNPTFYRFHRSLETYRKGLDENAFFLLSSNNRLLDFISDDRVKFQSMSEQDNSSGSSQD
jgi:membrane protease subunit HflC